MSTITNSTRVLAPDNRPVRRSQLDVSHAALMTPISQSPLGDGNRLICCSSHGSKRAIALNLRTTARIATWNVLSLAPLGYPEAMAREMARLNISIAGLTEVRIPNSGEQVVDGYTMLHSGEATKVRGMALLLSKFFSEGLISWEAISGRLLKARLKTSQGAITIIVAYAPTEDSAPEDKDLFYAQIESLVASIPRMINS